MDNLIKVRLMGAVVVLLLGMIVLPPLLKPQPPELRIEEHIPPQPPLQSAGGRPANTQNWTIGDVLGNQNPPDFSELEDGGAGSAIAKAQSQDKVLTHDQASSAINSEKATAINSEKATENQQVHSGIHAETAKNTQTSAQMTGKSSAQSPVAIEFDAQGHPVAWIIQVASFANNANAIRLENKLIETGYNAQIRIANLGKLTRVFVGPSMDKQGLERDKKAIEQTFKLKATIVRYRVGE